MGEFQRVLIFCTRAHVLFRIRSAYLGSVEIMSKVGTHRLSWPRGLINFVPRYWRTYI